MTIEVSVVEDDAHVRKLLASWIGHAAGFKLLGQWDNAETAFASAFVTQRGQNSSAVQHLTVAIRDKRSAVGSCLTDQKTWRFRWGQDWSKAPPSL